MKKREKSWKSHISAKPYKTVYEASVRAPSRPRPNMFHSLPPTELMTNQPRSHCRSHERSNIGRRPSPTPGKKKRRSRFWTQYSPPQIMLKASHTRLQYLAASCKISKNSSCGWHNPAQEILLKNFMEPGGKLSAEQWLHPIWCRHCLPIYTAMGALTI